MSDACIIDKSTTDEEVFSAAEISYNDGTRQADLDLPASERLPALPNPLEFERGWQGASPPSKMIQEYKKPYA